LDLYKKREIIYVGVFLRKLIVIEIVPIEDAIRCKWKLIAELLA